MSFTATYCHEDDDGNEHRVKITFSVDPGSPQTWDYPGDPPEIDFKRFECPANPAVAEWLSDAINDDPKLWERVSECCWESLPDGEDYED